MYTAFTSKSKHTNSLRDHNNDNNDNNDNNEHKHKCETYRKATHVVRY